jgi:Sec-independent protein translocase protein TatA
VGLGGGEIAVILVVVLLLFGPAIAAFFLGYSLGQRAGATDEQPAEEDASPAETGEPDQANSADEPTLPKDD